MNRYTRLAFVGLATLAIVAFTAPAAESEQPTLGSRQVPLLIADGLKFRDLNRNGQLDPYEDWRLSAETRSADLVSRMSLAEKAGAMMHASLPGVDGQWGGILNATRYDLERIRGWISDKHITSAITRLATTPASLAEQHNGLQEIAEQGRLGIPMTISTDPRNHFRVAHGMSVKAVGFSMWPEFTGLGAIGDPALVRRFAETARREYRATGIHMALSPMADLATEPRWGRTSGTFGENPELVRELVRAYVEGFQGGAEGLTRDGVISVVKHWAGYGAPAEQGFDGHNPYGRWSAFPGDAYEKHLSAFEGAFAVKVGGVMPTYTILRDLVHEGHAMEPVAGGFNHYLLNDLLRTRYGFDGMILSDWGITEDYSEDGGLPEEGKPLLLGTPWGMETASILERYAAAINAGIDQIGGTHEPEYLVKAVERGLLSEARIDEAVRRIVVDKFRLGLFENPFVSAQEAEVVLGNPETHAEAAAAQPRSLVLLKNEKAFLPLRSDIGERRVYLLGVDADIATARGFNVVANPAEADLAIVRLITPRELLHPNFLFGVFSAEGNLAFAVGQKDFDALVSLAQSGIPVIASVNLERPAVMTALIPYVQALFGDFGISHEALLDVVLGKAVPEGKLPFELPSSMEAVEAQKPDLPHDSENPLFPIGFGLRYE